MQARLAEANARYQGVTDGPDGPPVGTYQMQLRSAEFRESSEGNLIIRWTWVILDGEHQGEEISDISALQSEHPFPLKQLKKRMGKLGLEPPPNLWDYQERCPQITLMAPIILGGLKYRNDFAQVRIIELLQASTPAAAAVAAPVPAMPAAPVAAVPAPPVAAPIAAVPAPVVPVPPAPAAIGAGDTVRYTDPESGQAYEGLVDAVDAAGLATVALDANTAFEAPTTSLVLLAKAAVAVPTVPAPLAVPAPTHLPAAPAPATVATADPLRDQLLDLATTFGFTVNDLNSKEEIIAELATSEWQTGTPDGVDATEAALLSSVGIPVKVVAPPPPPPPPPAAAAAKPKAAKKKAKKKAKRRKRA
jgi:hypothetical protein